MTESEPRRSQRERKKPLDIYNVNELTASQKRSKEDENTSKVEDNPESEEDASVSSDGSDFEIMKKQKVNNKSRKITARKRRLPKSRKLPVVREKDGDSDSEEEDSRGNNIFEALRRSSSAIASVAAEWCDRYENQGNQALCELLNFLFQSCGAESLPVQDNSDVDQIDMNEMVQQVVEELQISNTECAVTSKKKAFKKFKKNFVEFWRRWVDECCGRTIGEESDLLNKCIDWFVTLSSAEVRAVRHTSTIAAYTIGSALISTLNELNRQLEVAKRQKNAERRKSKGSKKAEQLEKNFNRLNKKHENLTALMTQIFNGVFVHRYRDVMVELRVESLTTLGDWICKNEQDFLHDNYLKYLGWMLNDKHPHVRLTTIQTLQNLYEMENYAQKMGLFTSRFLRRYMEICKDVDEEVVLRVVELITTVDSLGLIDSETDLQCIEGLVFDDRNSSIRNAAAKFVCLQYDAFGELDSKSKHKDSTVKQHYITQAIALVEFAEEHIEENVEQVDLLVDAFWNSEDCTVLHEYSILTDLLLSDSNKYQLTSLQQTILIRIFVSVVRVVFDEASSSPKKNTKSLRDDEDKERVANHLVKTIGPLLTRFQEDSTKLEMLVQLPKYLDLNSPLVTQQNKHLSEILERLKEICSSQSQSALLSYAAASFQYLLQDHPKKSEVDFVLNDFIESLTDRLQALLSEDSNTMATGLKNKQQSSSKNSKSNKEQESMDFDDAKDLELALSNALRRFKCFFSYIDLRSITDLSHLMELLHDLIWRRDDLLCLTKSISSHYHPFVLSESIQICFLHFLWHCKPTFEKSKKYSKADLEKETDLEEEFAKSRKSRVCRKRSSSDSSEPKKTVLESLRDQCEILRKERDDFAELLRMVLWLRVDKENRLEDEDDVELDDLTESQEVYVQYVQSTAFQLVCDLKSLCVVKLEKTMVLSELAWTPDKHMLSVIQRYFERKMKDNTRDNLEILMKVWRLCNEKDSGEIEDEVENLEEWEKNNKEKTLLSLARASLCNTQNKRQSAAVISYMYGFGNGCTDIVKVFTKELKQGAPVRFLEVQMTCLRQKFNNYVEENEDGSKSNQEFCKQLKDMGRHLSHTLGIGRTTEQFRQPLVRFLLEGIRFACERPTQFMFFNGIRPYLHLLEKNSLYDLRVALDKHMDSFTTAVAAEYDQQEGVKSGERTTGWNSLLEFRDAVYVEALDVQETKSTNNTSITKTNIAKDYNKLEEEVISSTEKDISIEELDIDSEVNNTVTSGPTEVDNTQNEDLQYNLESTSATQSSNVSEEVADTPLKDMPSRRRKNKRSNNFSVKDKSDVEQENDSTPSEHDELQISSKNKKKRI